MAVQSARSLVHPPPARLALGVLTLSLTLAGTTRAQSSSPSPSSSPDAEQSGEPDGTALPPEPPPEPPPTEPPVDAEDLGPSPGPFRQGAIRLSLLIGSGSSSTENYFILGAGAGFYVLNGLEVGLDYEAWLGGTPGLQRLSPEARYVLWFVPTIRPYVGFFYRHTFVSGYDGLNSLGGRLGIYYAPERSRVYVGGGVVYERYLACTDSVLGGCSEIYPEFAVGASF